MKQFGYLVGLVVVLTIGGCGKSSDAEPGYSKADFQKTAPPPGWSHMAPGAPPPPPPSAGGPKTGK